MRGGKGLARRLRWGAGLMEIMSQKPTRSAPTAGPQEPPREDASLGASGAASGACLHCGSPVPEGSRDRYCCLGCRAVHTVLTREGLGRYYALGGGEGVPVGGAEAARDSSWLDAMEAELRASEGVTRLALDVQGVHCAACVWLQEELFTRRAKVCGGGLSAEVNPARGRIELRVTRAFDLRGFVQDVEQCGYRLGPPRKEPLPDGSGLVLRMGLALALMMNAMLFSIPLYMGLVAGPVFELFRWLTFGIGLASVAVGGPVFFRGAWGALRRGVLHLDVPISLGLVLAFSGSTWAFFARRTEGAYFDTLATFTALMLVGRWLQERVLTQNRARLLADDGVENLLVRRLDAGRVAVVRVGELRVGDTLMVAPGDLLAVSATLQSDASLRLDWISGESVPLDFSAGQVAPAGAFNAGDQALTAVATEDFAGSALPSLLRAPVQRPDVARATPWWQRITAVWVAAVLTLATLGFVGWAVATGDLARALEVATAVLVVTCPCAFGIASPMAYELVQSGLRRMGLFVRSASLLDRLPQVRQVVFDKTGTLTTGSLTLRDPAALDALPAHDLGRLYNLCARSTHPQSSAVRRALEDRGAAVTWDADAVVREVPGCGVECSADGVWRLGRAEWAVGPGAGAGLVLARDGALRARLDTEEERRHDARAEVASLQARGYTVWILSGDAPERVAAMAATLGVAPTHALGAMSPEAKAAWMAAHDQKDTLMVGDGVNDARAVEAAFCSLTPALDRPFLPARTDGWFVTPGLQPVRDALHGARALQAVLRRNLALATVYNVGAVGLSLAGWMTPLRCALLMPATSLSIVALTVASLGARRWSWR